MSYATIEELRSQLGTPQLPPEQAAYAAKMLHPLPPVQTVADRLAFVVERATGKRVYEFGASGKLHEELCRVAAVLVGIDRESSDGVQGFDLDDVSQQSLPAYPGGDPDLLVAGEILEHLGNPLWFLVRLKRQYPAVPLIVTVPNAFTANASRWLAKGLENVNKDHVAWYSPTTLSVLLSRAGYKTGELFYYNGTGPTAEGLIVLAD